MLLKNIKGFGRVYFDQLSLDIFRFAFGRKNMIDSGPILAALALTESSLSRSRALSPIVRGRNSETGTAGFYSDRIDLSIPKGAMKVGRKACHFWYIAFSNSTCDAIDECGAI